MPNQNGRKTIDECLCELAVRDYIRAALRGNSAECRIPIRNSEIDKAIAAVTYGTAAVTLRAAQPGILTSAALESGARAAERAQRSIKALSEKTRRAIKEGPSLEPQIIAIKDGGCVRTVVPYSSFEAIGILGIEKAFADAGVEVSAIIPEAEWSPVSVTSEMDSAWPAGYDIPVMPSVIVSRVMKGGD